jgi:PAS domain S-box-containing protein
MKNKASEETGGNNRITMHSCWITVRYLFFAASVFLFLSAGSTRVDLTPTELEFIHRNGPVTVCVDPDWWPYERISEDGEFSGIAADLLYLIADRTKLTLEIISTSHWTESLEVSKTGGCQIIGFLNQSAERDTWLNFTEPYFTDPNVFITREEHDFISDASVLVDATIVLPQGTSVEERVRRDFPNLKILLVETEADAIAMVDRRQADMTIRSLTMAAYIIKSEGWFNLKIAGQIPNYINQFRVGVIKDETELLSILNKGVASITSRDTQNAINRYVVIRVDSEMNWTLIAHIVLVFSIILALAFVWIRQLKHYNKVIADQKDNLQTLSEQLSADLKLRGKIETELRKNQRQLNGIIKNLPGFVYQCALDNHWTMSFLSDGCLEITGYKPLDFINNNQLGFDEIIHPEDRDMLRQEWEDVINKKGQFNKEYRIIHRDGSERWVLERGHGVYDSNGNLLMLEGFISDITSSVEAKKEIVLAKEQAEAANKAKSVFLANMSHEIRTPMSGVIGFADLLRSTPLNNHQKQYVNIIHNSSVSLLNIINDILDYSKIEAGKILIDPVSTDIVELVNRAADTLMFQASEKGLDLILTIQKDIPKQLVLDPVRIRQIIVNLLSNAVKFTHQGSVEINVSLVYSNDDVARLVITITDTGIGISEEQKTKLFQAFGQADSSTTRKFGGSGLGLVISGKLAKQMGGEITVTSEPEKGSTFTIIIPVSVDPESTLYSGPQKTLLDPQSLSVYHQTSIKPEIEVPASSVLVRPDPKDESGYPVILVVEDISVNKLLIRKLINSIYPSSVVLEAGNGLDAINKLGETPVDLVLMDVQMPVMDGLAATAKIRSSDTEIIRNLPVIALTAGVMQEERDRCKEAGMNDFLAKPVERDTLKNTLEIWLSKPSQ